MMLQFTLLIIVFSWWEYNYAFPRSGSFFLCFCWIFAVVMQWYAALTVLICFIYFLFCSICLKHYCNLLSDYLIILHYIYYILNNYLMGRLWKKLEPWDHAFVMFLKNNFILDVQSSIAPLFYKLTVKHATKDYPMISTWQIYISLILI